MAYCNIHRDEPVNPNSGIGYIKQKSFQYVFELKLAYRLYTSSWLGYMPASCGINSKSYDYTTSYQTYKILSLVGSEQRTYSKPSNKHHKHIG
jgi:hypothetical protein